MVVKAGGYYGSALQGFRGVTLGGLLSSTILNVVVYAVMRHWVKVMVRGTDEHCGHRQEGRQQN